MSFNFLVTASRFRPGATLRRAVHSPGIQAALAGTDGAGFYPNYRGVPVIGVYRWLPGRRLVRFHCPAESMPPVGRKLKVFVPRS